ncbi:hypothetical protein CDAR_385651 [Caerostris darwini]|uniref:Uncharacterized protein n=1 Tax=Caerostris darwini TaxID=1538125 RepID=A0AAV4M8G9_9ARAC|nr:hypothetical protein CDAR_385651 [Caerostris darwini]
MRRPITVQINNFKSNVPAAFSAGRASNDAPEGALFAQPNDTDKDGRGGRASNDAPEGALFAQPNDTDKDGRGGTMDLPLEMRFLVKRLIWLQWQAI